MRKLLGIVVIVAALGTFYFFNSNSKIQNDNRWNEEGLYSHPDPSYATFTFDDGEITLSGGGNVQEADGVIDETRLLDEEATGDLNDDGKLDSVVLLARSGGGSGVFVYVAAFVSGPVSYKGSPALFIGDRIAPESIEVSGNMVTIHYLDRGPDEAFAAEPTILTSKQFVYKNGEFVER